jgi:hypothetical protein
MRELFFLGADGCFGLVPSAPIYPLTGCLEKGWCGYKKPQEEPVHPGETNQKNTMETGLSYLLRGVRLHLYEDG